MEEVLRESEEKYRAVIKQSADAIFLMDMETNKVMETNRALRELLGYAPKEMEERSIYELMAHTTKEINFLIRAAGSLPGFKGERRYRSKDRSLLEMEVSASVIFHQKKQTLCVVARDVTRRKGAEEEMKKQFMRFKLEEKKLYLVKEKDPHHSIFAFVDLLNIGKHGWVISRNPRMELGKLFTGKFEFTWLAEREGKNTLPPDLGKIESYIESIPEKSAILLDRLDYLIFKSGFRETLNFVQHLREMCYLKNLVLILSVDPGTLKAEELRLLEKECHEVEEQARRPVSGPLMEVLEYVYNENFKGVKPSYGAIGKAFRMSKPTVGKKLGHLLSDGYLKLELRGNRKLLELTELGINVLSK